MSSEFCHIQKINKMEKKLIITPKTKVGELLDAYPDLEEVLIRLAPPFKKLKNPVLRRTVARVTTLQHAAIVGNIHVAKLVNTLREKAGQEILEGLEAGTSKSSGPPSWVDEKKIVRVFDARPVIEAGQNPLGEVLGYVQQMKSGEIYVLETPFLPAPMIEKVTAMGFDTWSKPETDNHYKNYFFKL